MGRFFCVNHHQTLTRIFSAKLIKNIADALIACAPGRLYLLKGAGWQCVFFGLYAVVWLIIRN